MSINGKYGSGINEGIKKREGIMRNKKSLLCEAKK